MAQTTSKKLSGALAMADSLRIIGALSGEHLCDIPACPTTNLWDLKLRIHSAIGLDPTQQKLIHKGFTLSDNDAILGPSLFLASVPTILLIKLDALAARREFDRQVVLSKVKSGTSLLRLDREFCSDGEVVLVAARRTICQLQHAAPELLCNPDFVLAALCISSLARCYAATELWSNRDFVHAAVQLDGSLLEIVDEALKGHGVMDDMAVVLAAVAQHGHALKFAGVAAKCNKEVVLQAVRQRGTALAHAGDNMRCDREVVLAAVAAEKMAVVHALGGLRGDPYVLKLVDQHRVAEGLILSCGRSENCVETDGACLELQCR